MDREAWRVYSPWGHKELDAIELIHVHTHFLHYVLLSPAT